MENYPLQWSFVGNPGTGKSAVAKIMVEILKAMYLLKTDKMSIFNAGELLAGGISVTPDLLEQQIQEANQGLLFINSSSQAFNEQNHQNVTMCIRALLKAHEPKRSGRYALILSERFSSRAEICKSLSQIGIYDFDYTIIFDDYTTSELLEILHRGLAKLNLSLDEEASIIMGNYIKRLANDYQSGYANARTMRLLSFAIQKIGIANHVTTGVITADLVTDLAQASVPKAKRLGF